MKPTISNGLVVTIVFLTGTLQAQQREPVTISVGISLANQYLWRGFVSNDAPSAQPGMTVEFTNFSISSWSNLSQTGPNGQLWTEHDLMLDYTQQVGSFSLSIGYINYIFPDIEPGEGRQTNEVYFGLAHDNLLSPSVTVYRDFDEGEGWYYYLSLGHAFKLPKGLSLNPSVGGGLNQHLFIEQTTVSNCDLGVSIDIPLGGITLSPFFTRMIGNRSIFGSHNMYGVTMSLNN